MAKVNANYEVVYILDPALGEDCLLYTSRCV